jgi:hypothetical protein
VKSRAPAARAGRTASAALWIRSNGLATAALAAGVLLLACIPVIAAVNKGAESPSALAAARSCSGERPSKAKSTTVGALRARAAASKTYKLKVQLIAMRQVGGGQIALVIGDPGKPSRTMIATFPASGCKGKKKQSAPVRKARAALVSACGKPARDATPLEGSATITGVASFAPPGNQHGAAPNGIQLNPVVTFRATGCKQRVSGIEAPVAPATAAGAPPAAAPQGPPATPPPPPIEPPPVEPPVYPPPPAPDPADAPCTRHLRGGAIESFANQSPDQVVCLATGYYMEPKDALIVLKQPGVRVQPDPGAWPIVCGHIVPRAPATSVSTGVHPDPSCDAYFNEDSPFNKVASDAAVGPPVPIPSTWLPDFDGTGTGHLQLSREWTHGKAIFRARPPDPVTATFRIADASQCMNDPNGCGPWQPDDPNHIVKDASSSNPDLLPIPAGVRCPGLPVIDDQHDRALVVISADGKTAWEFWHCTHVATPAEPWYTAAIATKWQLDPDNPSPANRGYQDLRHSAVGSGSARASGVPLLTTTITPREAFFGIHHAIGLTVKQIETGFVNPPASHTDDCPGCSHLIYGMLFVLDPRFPIPEDATFGQIAVIQALKKYGAYIVDRGPNFELDGSPNEPSDPGASDNLWAAAGLDQDLNGLDIKASDLLYVPTLGSPPALP